MKYGAIFSAFYGQPLLLSPEKADEIRWFLERREAGIATGRSNFPEQPQAYLTNERGAVAPVDAVGNSGSGKFVAVLPLFGTLFQHGGIEMDASGGTSLSQFSDQFSRLAANPSIKSIVIETHSPGGQVWGTQETADLIRAERDSGRTRIVSVANSMAASAAVWIMTAASEVNVTPGGELGSIGVVTMHQDISGAEAKEGVKTTLVAYPEKKIEAHSYAPLTNDARSELESKIRAAYQRFVGGVARNRNVSTAVVESKFGSGGMLRAEQAVAVGLADRIATRQQVLSREVRMISGDGGQRRSVKNRLAIERLNN